eukprot:Pgem_evm1s1396
MHLYFFIWQNITYNKNPRKSLPKKLIKAVTRILRFFLLQVKNYKIELTLSEGTVDAGTRRLKLP